jgi:colanic acid biosynthesis glycosyl transferase WcaI
MHILVLAINYWPEATGIGAAVTRRCEYLASLGHEVTVCTGMPYYPQWRIHSDYAGKLLCREQRNRVTILRSWIWVPKRVTSAKRVLLEASFLTSSLLRALPGRKPELLLLVSPPLGLGLAARILSRRFKTPYVFDVEDLQPDAAADLGMLPPPVLPLLYRLEAMAYRHASLITTVTGAMRQRIIDKGIPAARVAVVAPPADGTLFGVGSAGPGLAFRRQHNLEGKMVVAHSGNMGVKQGLDLVLDVAVLLKARREIVFLLAGDGAMKPHLENRAEALRLDNVRFLPLQEPPEFRKMLAAIDLALIVQQPSVSDIAFPSKTVTLLSAARPVAASVSAQSEVARVLTGSNGGLVSAAGKPEALAESIVELFEDPERRSAMGEHGRRYAMQHWDESLVLPDFAAHLLKTAGELEPAVLAEGPAAA